MTIFAENIAVPSTGLTNKLEEISRLRGFDSLAALPDCSVSKSEGPNSLVSAFSGYVVPQLLPKGINCGMALMRLDVGSSQVAKFRDEIVAEVHHAMMDSQALDDREFLDVCEHGVEAIARLLPRVRYDDLAAAMLDGGKSNLDVFIHRRYDRRAIIRDALLYDQEHRKVPGNPIKGNHFIEFYGAHHPDHVGEPETDGVFAAFHFGTAFGGRLTDTFMPNREKSRRRRNESLRTEDGRLSRDIKQWMRLVKKYGTVNGRALRFHLDAEGLRRLPWIATRFHSPRRYKAIALDSPEGQRLLHVQKYGFNLSAAARLAMCQTIATAVNAVLGKTVDWELVWEAGHDHFRCENTPRGKRIVSRKGCAPNQPGRNVFVAGLHNAPSLLLEGRATAVQSDSWGNSFDHGMGVVLSAAQNKEVVGRVGRVRCYRPRSVDQGFSEWSIRDLDVEMKVGLKMIWDTYEKKHPVHRPARYLIPIMNYKVGGSLANPSE